MVARYLRLLLLTASLTLAASLNKCCEEDQQFEWYNETFHCVDDESDVRWSWVPTEHLHLLDNKSVGYGWNSNHSCLGENEYLQYKMHYNLHVVDGEIVLNVTQDSALHFPSSAFCVERPSSNGEGPEFVARLCLDCEEHKCVRKCCENGYNIKGNVTGSLHSTKDCVLSGKSDWPTLTESEVQYYVLNEYPLCQRYGITIVRNSNTTSTQKRLLLQPDGSIKLDGHTYPAHTFCGDYTADDDELLVYCLEDVTDWKPLVYGVMIVINSMALFVAILLAVILPDLRRNLHGRMTLAHNVMFFIGSVLLGVIFLMGPSSEMTQAECQVVSFIILFSFLSTFFWLNVMCIDIAWVFSGLRSIHGDKCGHQLIFYCLYAWGTPAAITLVAGLVEFIGTDQRFRPNFGEKGRTCFFNNRLAQTVFFHAPMAILLLVNLVLFLYTATKITVIKRETSMLRSQESSINKKNERRLLMYGKLFCVMGVTWIFEVIGFALESKSYLFVFADLLNLSRGVFIFIIFCCKRTVYEQALHRLRECSEKRARAQLSTSRGTTLSANSIKTIA